MITDQTFAEVPEEASCPFELEHVWVWFRELDATRQNGLGPGPITHQEITAWANGMQVGLTPFERRAIREIDRAYIVYSNSKDDNGRYSKRK